MYRQPIQAHELSPYTPRRNSIDHGCAGVERRRAYHNASLGCARRHEVEIARRWVAVVERAMLMAVLAAVFVPCAAGLLGQSGPGSAYVLQVLARMKRAGVLNGDLDQAVRLNVSVLAAGDNGILESPPQAVSGENSVGMRHLSQLTG